MISNGNSNPDEGIKSARKENCEKIQKILVFSLLNHLKINDDTEQEKIVYCRVHIIFKSKTGHHRKGRWQWKYIIVLQGSYDAAEIMYDLKEDCDKLKIHNVNPRATPEKREIYSYELRKERLNTKNSTTDGRKRQNKTKTLDQIATW